MDELKYALGKLYEEFGHGPVIVRLSQILDDLIVEEQKERLKNVDSNSKRCRCSSCKTN